MNWSEMVEYYVLATTRRYQLLVHLMNSFVIILAATVFLAIVLEQDWILVGTILSIVALLSLSGHMMMCIVYQGSKSVLGAALTWSSVHMLALCFFIVAMTY